MARSPKVAVIDASVVVKWFKDEAHTDRALALREDWAAGRVSLHTIELLLYEALNALRYDPIQTEATLRRAAANLRDYPFRLIPMAEIAERTAENALRHGISVYDAAYLSAGEELGAPTYTADEKLIAKVGGGTLHSIADYGTIS
ncbi:MAG: type II toxin-antitoxin system VapC family toxin [Candidatus Bathyarchaeota archaeon]